MKVAVAGAGKVGLFIANDLARSGHDVLLLEKEEGVLEKLDIEPRVNATLADSCELRTLQRLDLSSYDVMSAATGDDEDNLVTALLAKQEFAVPRVVARVNHPENERLFNEAWGVDISVSTPHLLSALVEEATMTGHSVRLLTLHGGTVNLVEITLNDATPIVGMQISALDLPCGVTIVSIVREGAVVRPGEDERLFAGDEVVVLADVDAEQALKTLFATD